MGFASRRFVNETRYCTRIKTAEGAFGERQNIATPYLGTCLYSLQNGIKHLIQTRKALQQEWCFIYGRRIVRHTPYGGRALLN